jgi:hypothetical protein
MSFIGLVRVQMPVVGSNSSALDKATGATGEVEAPGSPPATRTIPLGSRVAVWKARPSFIGLTTVQLPFTGSLPGSNISAVFRVGPPAEDKPPVTSTLPSSSNVAVWAVRGEWRSLNTFFHEFVLGVYTSAVLGSLEVSPPTTSTCPVLSSVAVLRDLTVVISLGVQLRF